MKLFTQRKFGGIRSVLVICLVTIFSACEKKSSPVSVDVFAPGTFGFDLAFLNSKDNVIVLKTDSSQLIVSPKYQGKVFTSTASGSNGKSFGWINYAAFDKPLDVHMNAYGGENRFWLGPEGNKFSLFFDEGAAMDFPNWKTPPAIDSEPWSVSTQNQTSVTLNKNTTLRNYAGTAFKIVIDRTISILTRDTIDALLNTKLTDSISTIGYSTFNKISNAGDNDWTKTTGAPCIWILDMFNPSPATTIIIPYNGAGTGKVVTSDYFGEVPPERLAIKPSVVLFKADGAARGKIGLSPGRASNIAGSLDLQNNVLTVVLFDVDPAGTYLNQEWNTTKDPFAGDAINAYNDGPLADGTQMGPFYELESVSPAAFLKPGESLTHVHHVFHFTGTRAHLKALAAALFKTGDLVIP